MANLFEAVEIVNRLTKLRKDIQHVLGTGYDSRVKEYMAVVRTFPEPERLSRVISMSSEMMAAGHDLGAQLLMCGYVELTEEKTPAAAHGR